MAPRISVLMPCFNHGAFIDEAVGSLAAQTFQDFELIVVDDGSTDALTAEKLSDYAARSTIGLEPDGAAGTRPRVTVLTTSNRGLPAARNHAARHASGALFCALDADDRLAPTWFEKAIRVLDEQAGIAFVSHWLETFGDERWTWTPDRCDLQALLARNAVNGAAVVRREPFEAVGGYDETMREGCEDWDFWLRLVERGYTGAIVPEILFYYRRRADSMSRAMLEEHAYRRPLATLVAKHEAAYRTHLVDVMVAKEAESLQLSREIADLERDRLVVLEPALQRAREEAAALAGKAARARAARAREEELVRLSWKAGELERQVADLRSSRSWRITAPLRRLYGLFARSGR